MEPPSNVDIVVLVPTVREKKITTSVCKCGAVYLKKVVMERKEEQKKSECVIFKNSSLEYFFSHRAKQKPL
jgi:hypothetical protein